MCVIGGRVVACGKSDSGECDRGSEFVRSLRCKKSSMSSGTPSLGPPPTSHPSSPPHPPTPSSTSPTPPPPPHPTAHSTLPPAPFAPPLIDSTATRRVLAGGALVQGGNGGLIRAGGMRGFLSGERVSAGVFWGCRGPGAGEVPVKTPSIGSMYRPRRYREDMMLCVRVLLECHWIRMMSLLRKEEAHLL